MRISWRATCKKGHYTSPTLFQPPFDVRRPTAFEDEGTYRGTPDGYRARHTAFVSATLGAGERLARHVPGADAGNAEGAGGRQLPAQGVRWSAKEV